MILKVLLDQGIPYSTVDHLKSREWDVVHTVDVGLSRATDREIIEYARKEGRVCITLDSDFHTILAVNGMNGPSAIRIRQERLNGLDMARLLRQVLSQIRVQLESGCLVTVTDEAIRIRKLPV